MLRLVPSAVERNAFRVLGAVAFIALGLLTKAYFDQQDAITAHNEQLARQSADIAEVVIINCEQNRQLISNIVLRTAGVKYKDYKKDPERVLRLYRRQLLLVTLYRENPELLDRVMDNTRATLSEADPEKCKGVSVKP